MDKIVASVLMVACLIIGVLAGYAIIPAKSVVSQVDKPVLVMAPYNDSAVKSDLTELKNEVLKDKNWESSAIALAQADLEERDYKDLFNWMTDNRISIKEKTDISKVIIKDSSFSGDAKDKDASVTLNLKVYYEDKFGNSKKAYINAEYVITDNEVDDVKYSLA
jgi:hypothetical protein